MVDFNTISAGSGMSPSTSGLGSSTVTESQANAFQLACAGKTPPGTAVIGRPLGLGARMPQALEQELQSRVAANGGQKLDTIILSDKMMKRGTTFDAATAVGIAQKYLAPGGKIAIAQDNKVAATPKQLQAIADATGLTIVAGSSEFSSAEKGTVTYQKGKPPMANPAGRINDGGLGLRSISCDTPGGIN